MASIPDVAHSLTLACLDHEGLVMKLAEQAHNQDSAASMGSRIGEFFGGVLEAVQAAFAAASGHNPPAAEGQH